MNISKELQQEIDNWTFFDGWHVRFNRNIEKNFPKEHAIINDGTNGGHYYWICNDDKIWGGPFSDKWDCYRNMKKYAKDAGG